MHARLVEIAMTSVAERAKNYGGPSATCARS